MRRCVTDRDVGLCLYREIEQIHRYKSSKVCEALPCFFFPDESSETIRCRVIFVHLFWEHLEIGVAALEDGPGLYCSK